MEQAKKKEENELAISPYLLFGTFSIGFLGTVICGYVSRHVKHTDSKSAEA